MKREMGKVKALDKYLSESDVFAMSIGVMVGWGAFVMPGTTFLPAAGAVGTVIAMGISVIIMLIIAANFAFLMKRSPGTGGVYSYTKEAFGLDHAFLSSWFLCLSYLTVVFLNGTAIFIVVRTLADGSSLPGFHYNIAGNEIYLFEVLISFAAFAGVGIMFLVAKPLLQGIFRVLAFIMVAGSAVILIVCLPHIGANGAASSYGITGSSELYEILSIVVIAPWAFIGFDVVSFDTAHFKFPVKKVKKPLYASIIEAGLVYAALAVCASTFVPDGYAGWTDYLSSLGDIKGIESVPSFAAAHAYMGTAGVAVITITALAAIFTGIIGAYRAALRVLSTMAEDHILSEKFTDTKTSIIFIMVISVILSMLGRNTLNWFVDITSFGAIVGYGYVSAATFKIGKAEGKRKPKTLGLIGTVISVVLGLVQIVPHLSAFETMGSQAFLMLALWCMLGFVFYLRTVNETALSEFTGISTSGIVLFALLIYSSLMWMAKSIAAADGDKIERTLTVNGIIVMVIIFAGLAIMMHIQNLMRKKHEVIEREKIRAVESSLAKSQFLFNMSHDIRTPMNAIIGYTNLAQEENDTDKLHEFLSKIEASGKHLLDLVNDILEMSRIESGTTELEYVPTDLCKLFSEINDLFQNQMEEKGLEFGMHTSQVKNRYVWCDKKNLTRVLMNVISNAYKFTPEGGTIDVSLWEGASSDQGYTSYEMRVSDSGIGMSKDFADKMFNAFERERSSTVSGIEGTGLGLAITKSLVDMMGGNIEVITSPGSGTDIVIRLRFRLASESDLPEEEKNAAEVAEGSEVDFSTKRLLLVEDNAINMEIANMILTQMGFDVETAVNGQIAFDMVKEAESGYYDLILMDIQMPVMDGYEATKAIRALDDKEKASVPVVAMTANAFAEDVQAANDAGMQAHIAKPVDIAVLTQTLKDVLSEKGE